MDIMMPGVDGLAATSELRRLSPDTAVAVVSAHRDEEWITRAEAAGASAYVPKGGSLEEMIQMLRTARPGRMVVAPSLRAQAAGMATTARQVDDERHPLPAGGGTAPATGHRIRVGRGFLRSLSLALHLTHPEADTHRARPWPHSR